MASGVRLEADLAWTDARFTDEDPEFEPLKISDGDHMTSIHDTGFAGRGM